MKTHFFKYFFILATLFMSGACSYDELNKTPVGRFASEDYLTTDEEALSAIIGVYDHLAVAYNNYADWSSLFLLKTLPGDDLHAGGGSSADMPKMQTIDNLTHEYDNPAIGDVWLSLYRIVSSSNSIIANIGEGVSPSIRRQIIAEAKFFRAYAYFELVTMFGAVPHYTVNPITQAETHIARTPVATIYAAIEKDLTEAAADLPLKSQLPEGQKFRIAKGTAQSLLGKVFLYQKKYAAAHTILRTVIASNKYSLESDFGSIWLRDARAGAETIFEVLYSSQNGHTWAGPWDGTAESNFMIQLMGPRDGSFLKIDTIGYTSGWGFNVPTGEFGGLLYNYAGDIRRNASVISEARFVAAGGVVDRAAGNNWDAYEGYIRLKYATRLTETGPPVTQLNYGTPFKIIRYADVLLMAAEAYNRDGNDLAAVDLIRLVRERAGFTDHSSWETLTGNDLFNFIVRERSLELAFEGHRFWDLVRWGRAGAEIDGFEVGKHELFPIPKREIDLNTAIEHEHQNPGF